MAAELVEIETFDSLMARLWKQVPHPDPALVAKVGRSDQAKVSIPVPDTGMLNPIIRMNALPVKLPASCLTLDPKEMPEAEDLERIETASWGSISAIKADGTAWAWGTEPSLQKAFGPNLESVTETDIADRITDLGHNLFLKPLIERTIALGLIRGRPLVARRWRDRTVLIVKDTYDGSGADPLANAVKSIHASPLLKGVVPNLMTVPDDKHPEAEVVRWAEALEVKLQEIDRDHWILIKPLVWIWPARSRRDANAFLDARAGKRYNAQADLLMSAWIKFLLPSQQRNIEHVVAPFGDTGTLGAPRFLLNDRTTFSRRAAP